MVLVNSGFTQAKEFRRNLGTRHEMFCQTCPRMEKFKEYRFEGPEIISLPGPPTYLGLARITSRRHYSWLGDHSLCQ